MTTLRPTGCCICPSWSLPGVSCITRGHILLPGTVIHAKVLCALCSAWTPCAALTLKRGSGCVHVPHAQPWSGCSHCSVRVLQLWEGVHFPACSLCPQSVGLSARAHLHFSPGYEDGGPHHLLRHYLHHFIITQQSVFFESPDDPPILHPCCPSHFCSLNSRFPLSWGSSAITLGSRQLCCDCRSLFLTDTLS